MLTEPLTIAQIRAFTDFCRRSHDWNIKNGLFPAPIKTDERLSRQKEEDIKNYMAFQEKSKG